MVLLRAVSRSFRAPGGQRLCALQLAKLQLEAGEALLVTGANGAGKTTLLHVVAGLLRPDRGLVQIAGQDLTKLTESRLDRVRAHTVGVLHQRAQLLDGLTAAENVMAALLFAGVPRRKQRRRAAELLERFGVAHRARHFPPAMSGGERQRVALARALANDPPLLLADEPTAALDADSAEQLVEELARLRREEKRTLLVVTHEPQLFGQGYRHLELEPPS